MKKIKKRTPCTVQTKTSFGNTIGEAVNEWSEFAVLSGVLGLQSGDSKRTYSTKLEESTHVFICDYNEAVYGLADQDVRCIIKGKMYDVLLIDNPDEMDYHLEIYLKLVGGQNG